MNILQRVYLAIFKNQKKNFYLRALLKVNPPNLYPDIQGNAVHFKHFGLIGDIIYSIPAMKALANGKEIHLHLHIDQPSLYKRNMRHYNQGKILTQKSVEMIAPLLLSQPEIKCCDIYTDQRIDFDLDDFRKYPFDYNMGHICRWYFLTYGISADLSKSWLKVNPDTRFKNEILIARSFRYRAPGISYNFLKDYNNIGFVGLQEEYEDMKRSIPQLNYHPVKDFLELARAIAGCRFFIGNQSFPYSLAEALKAKRALEVCFENPNVIPEGDDAYDFCYQPQFEKIVKQLNETS
jgi:hypothetical protein